MIQTRSRSHKLRVMTPAPAAGGGNPYPAILANLTSWYPFEADGNDAHTNALHLTANNGPSYAAGKVNNATLLESANTEYFSRASETALQVATGDFTLAAWVYPIGEQASYATIMKKWGEFYFAVKRTESGSGNGRPYFALGDGVDIQAQDVQWGSGISDDAWHFVVAWHDVSESKIYLSIDDGTPVSTTYNTFTPATNSEPFWIGFHAGAVRFNGYMDEIGIWKGYVLSADERTWLYNSGAGRAYSELSA